MPGVPRNVRRTVINYEEDSKSQDNGGAIPSLPPPPLFDGSYIEGPAAALQSNGSRSSLGKRLASQAFDMSGPKDFEFLFHQTPDEVADEPLQQQQQQQQLPRQTVNEDAPSVSSSESAPDRVDGEGVLWVRTPIRRASDLVDGQAWIQDFERRLRELPQKGGGCRDVGIGNNNRGGASFTRLAEGRVLKEMAKVCPPGRKLRLPTGEEVIFWFNVGAPGPLQRRVYVTEAKCPHQGVCLLSGELTEIEDAAGLFHAFVRCPRHNKRFNLQNGLSPGNSEVLRTYPCRFMHGFWYVGLDHTRDATSDGMCEVRHQRQLAFVDVEDSEPSAKKLRMLLESLGNPCELEVK
mmetsp:Transcript_6103/g.11355  ORF Transcript_6103/g.11355 Transcript_6103/m.11355 type:complete len:349 (-) Transcript_6103:189-1235(-)|eukprot:CAMPEP_0172679208 /NCGR_PEP_ID=MMETSP1074-20121228/15908_1 /TAXON_ID=2916 /ORGANISM="Ceratium fusus, Strain PA161109" /LENGTH=348 /DNA_ID=CAMNT_0013497343 /DNA_START=66 /DNA_END=1112 /DNA_ORIENTATION=-